MNKSLSPIFKNNQLLSELETLKLIYDNHCLQSNWEQPFLTDDELYTLLHNKFHSKERMLSLHYHLKVIEVQASFLQNDYHIFEANYARIDNLLKSYEQSPNLWRVVQKLQSVNDDSALMDLISLGWYCVQKKATQIQSYGDFFKISIMDHKDEIVDFITFMHQLYEKFVVRYDEFLQLPHINDFEALKKFALGFCDLYHYRYNNLRERIKDLHIVFEQYQYFRLLDLLDMVKNWEIPMYDGYLDELFTDSANPLK
jgi:hypothetical protein